MPSRDLMGKIKIRPRRIGPLVSNAGRLAIPVDALDGGPFGFQPRKSNFRFTVDTKRQYIYPVSRGGPAWLLVRRIIRRPPASIIPDSLCVAFFVLRASNPERASTSPGQSEVGPRK